MEMKPPTSAPRLNAKAQEGSKDQIFFLGTRQYITKCHLGETYASIGRGPV